MKLGVAVSFEEGVLTGWRAALAGRDPHPLFVDGLEGVGWFEAVLESGDRQQLRLIPSADLLEAFGTDRLAEARHPDLVSDSHGHGLRARALLRVYRRGVVLEPPILVGESGQGPFLIVDGNHRCIAAAAAERLDGLAARVGFAPGLFASYRWAFALR